jgi:hypothetical protein
VAVPRIVAAALKMSAPTELVPPKSHAEVADDCAVPR